MNAVVTGATSFLGSGLVEHLLNHRNKVYAVIRPGSQNRGALKEGAHNLVVLERSLEELSDLSTVIGEPCEEFYHFGWDGSGSENRMKQRVQQKNVKDSLKALEGARRLGCRRFLFSGSQAEYGISVGAMSETSPCAPVSEYGRAKLEFLNKAEKLCRQWEEEGICHMEYIHARIFSVYGPGDHPWSLVESCLHAFKEGEYISLGECTQQWNFLYVRDCVQALSCLMESNGTCSGVYNVAGTQKDTRVLKEYIRLMYELCGFHGSYSYGRRAQNAEGPANLIPDINKLLEKTGWQPSVDFKEGIRLTLQAEKY